MRIGIAVHGSVTYNYKYLNQSVFPLAMVCCGGKELSTSINHENFPLATVCCGGKETKYNVHQSIMKISL